MNTRTFVALVCTFCLMLGIAIGRAQSQDRKQAVGEWEKLTGPTENHKKIAPLAGKWTITARFPDGKGKWIESPGTSEFRWTMGNRFLIEETKTTMMGQPFEWMGTHGYNNMSREFESAWIDNLGTGIDMMKGRWDEASKMLSYLGDLDDPSSGGKATVKWNIRFDGPDKTITEMYQIGADKREEKVLEILAVRAK
jgi:hypothetical protein